jgi:endoglucanase Acf2
MRSRRECQVANPPAEVRAGEAPDLRDLVRQMLTAAVTNEEVVLASFPLDAASVTAPGVQTSAFWRSLLLGERLGEQFEHPWVLDRDIR